MSARRLLRFVFVCVTALVLLTGCVTALAPARPLITESDSHIAYDVVVAVQSNGIKHYAWTECGGASCRLVYQRVRFGTPIYQSTFAEDSGSDVRYPDLAVTIDGRAFVVYSLCSSTCVDYYSIIPPDADDNTPITSEQLASPDGNSMGPPKLKARDNIVYATYLFNAEPEPRLRYRQLSGGTSGGYVDMRADVLPSAPSLAIGGDGVLHVTWKASNSSFSEIAYSTNSGTTGDFGPPISYDSSVNYIFRNPDIALDSSNTPYIVYTYDGEASDIVKIRCGAVEAGDCFGGVSDRTIALNSAQNPWWLRGSPHIQVLGTSPAVVFAADNSATDNNEIWYYTPPSSGIDPGPTRVTNNAVQDHEPQIVVERSNFGDVPVVAWRTYATVLMPPGLNLDCFGDAYMFYFTPSTVQRVFTGSGSCRNDAQELAANGPWVAGVWLDRLDSGDDSLAVPWTLFNANTMYAPITAK